MRFVPFNSLCSKFFKYLKHMKPPYAEWSLRSAQAIECHRQTVHLVGDQTWLNLFKIISWTFFSHYFCYHPWHANHLNEKKVTARFVMMSKIFITRPCPVILDKEGHFNATDSILAPLNGNPVNKCLALPYY